MRALVLGGAGFVAGELLRLLARHPQIDVIDAASRSAAGQRWSSVHPGLVDVATSEDRAPRFVRFDLERVAGADLVFLALEHGASRRLIEEGLLERTRARCVVDLADDFRVPRGGAHGFRYALADVEGATLKDATRLAAPGCFATAAQLALHPLAAVARERALTPTLFAVTGSSGAGIQPKVTTHHPLRAHNLFAYSVLGHRHELEIGASWSAWTGGDAPPPRLLAHSGPFVRGIYLTLHVRGVAGIDVAQRFREAYGGRPFVRVLGADEGTPQLTHVIGTNRADIGVAIAGDEAQVMVSIDNLIKGAGGQALQALNLSLGWDESLGLAGGGSFPC